MMHTRLPEDHTLRATVVAALLLAGAVACWWGSVLPSPLLVPGLAILAVVLIPYVYVAGASPVELTAFDVVVLAIGIVLLSAVAVWWRHDAVTGTHRPSLRLGTACACLVAGIATVAFGLVGGYDVTAPVWGGLGLALVLASRAAPTLGTEPLEATARRALPFASRPRRFLLDATVATIPIGLAIAFARLYVEPWVLQIPGMILYYPFLVVYIVSGGDLAGPDAGPTPLELGSYVVVLGLLSAWLAQVGRRRVDTEKTSFGRLVVAGIATAAVVVAGLYQFGVATSLVGPAAFLATLVGLAVGLLVVAAWLWMRERTESGKAGGENSSG